MKGARALTSLEIQAVYQAFDGQFAIRLRTFYQKLGERLPLATEVVGLKTFSFCFPSGSSFFILFMCLVNRASSVPSHKKSPVVAAMAGGHKALPLLTRPWDTECRHFIEFDLACLEDRGSRTSPSVFYASGRMQHPDRKDGGAEWGKR